MKLSVSRVIPHSIKQYIKQSNWYTHREVSQLAISSKRIDICAAQMAHVLHLSQHPSIEGKVCLELGSGWVLSHALVFYLLGAKKVISSDIVPVARPETLLLAVRQAIASIPRDILAPFSEHSRIRERYNRLLSISRFDFDALHELGIEYLSPIDLSKERISTTVDFIYSNSVLEHVPVNDIPGLLDNLVGMLNQDGVMIHCIHLEDHKDISGDPFSFLSIPDIQYSRILQSNRGNRVRYSGWKKLFENLDGTSTEFFYIYSRKDKPLPKSIDSSISYNDEDDLRISHIGVYTKKFTKT